MEAIVVAWEQLIDDETIEQLAEWVRKEYLQVLVVKLEIKNIPTKEKIAKGVELK